MSLFNNWTQLNKPLEAILPPVLAPWLACRGSLTKRLQSALSAPPSVNVLMQGWSTPTQQEAQMLRVDPSDRAVIREVQLCEGPKALVYARTVIPQNAFSASFNFVDSIGDQPLGHWLFTTEGVERGDIWVRQKQAFEVNGTVFDWGRRSVFEYKGHELLVAEYFAEGFDL